MQVSIDNFKFALGDDKLIITYYNHDTLQEFSVVLTKDDTKIQLSKYQNFFTKCINQEPNYTYSIIEDTSITFILTLEAHLDEFIWLIEKLIFIEKKIPEITRIKLEFNKKLQSLKDTIDKLNKVVIGYDQSTYERIIVNKTDTILDIPTINYDTCLGMITQLQCLEIVKIRFDLLKYFIGTELKELHVFQCENLNDIYQYTDLLNVKSKKYYLYWTYGDFKEYSLNILNGLLRTNGKVETVKYIEIIQQNKKYFNDDLATTCKSKGIEIVFN